ncbi:hypothetical protein EJB05_53539, partial [Eragrostis curvula]
MFPDRSSSPPPAVESANPTTIDALGEDLLLEIFLRLPSLATLVRAVLTCRAWRSAVASSPSFLRRFRALHRAPLLGLFADLERCALPVFAPFYRRDWDVLAAIGRGDFALTSLLHPNDFVGDAVPLWRLCDCRGGYLLLMNRDADLLATVNPLSRQNLDYIDFHDITETTGTAVEDVIMLYAHLLCSDEEPMTFQVVFLLHDQSRVRAAVFSSDTRDWCFHPWVEIPERRTQPVDANKCWLCHGMHVGSFIYWIFKIGNHVLMLDTETMEFSVLELPSHIVDQQDYILVGGTLDGAPCIVYRTGLVVGVTIYRVDEDGDKRWTPGRTVQYEDQDDPPENDDVLRLMAIENGFAYLVTSKMVLSLCIETMEIEKLFPRSFCYIDYAVPYVMAWPASLVGSYGSFAANHNGAIKA